MERHSQRCDIELKLAVCSHLLQHDIIYFLFFAIEFHCICISTSFKYFYGGAGGTENEGRGRFLLST